jgi:hypothetical protein
VQVLTTLAGAGFFVQDLDKLLANKEVVGATRFDRENTAVILIVSRTSQTDKKTQHTRRRARCVYARTTAYEAMDFEL